MKKMMKITCLLIALLSIVFVGCSKQEQVNVYTRDTDSGTRDCFFSSIDFKEAAEDDSPLKKGALTTENNDSMISSIKNDEFGIGYISLATLEISGLKGLDYEGVKATEENVLNGSYKIARNFNYCLRDEYSSEDEKQICLAFIAYMQTKEGKATIQSKDGIVEIKATDPSWNDIKSNYPVSEKDNSSITIKFGGSTSVQKLIKALAEEFSSKCGNFVVEQNHTGSSDGYKRTQGSEKDGANYLSIGFLSRELKSTEVVKENTSGAICMDAVVVVVNKANSAVNNITKEVLKKLFTGEINSWDEVK